MMTQEWIPCSERLPKKDGKYSVTVDKDVHYFEPKRKVYHDCGFDVEKQLFYFYTSYIEPHHLGPTETLRIYIQPNGHVILTGEPIAWTPEPEVEPWGGQ